ncbi:hypothetical protein HDU97_007119 [Phlyctochytrium planicorne]|nr:hypothetical protein HDU97_007119 [Phlyctochytrium planicorne]
MVIIIMHTLGVRTALLALFCSTASAQFTSWAVSKKQTYYTKIDNSVGYLDNINVSATPVPIAGFLSSVTLYGNSLAGVGPAGDFYVISGSIPPPNPNAQHIWTPLQGEAITKASGNKDGELWLITSLLRLHKVVGTQWGFPRDETVDGKVIDLHVRDQIYIVTVNKTVCWRGFAQNPIYECNAPSFTPRFVAASENFVYVLSTAGNLFVAPKPLTPNSTFQDTGFASPGARMLGMPIDYEKVYVLDSGGAPVENICGSQKYNCKPQLSPLQTTSPSPSSSSSTSQGLSIPIIAGISSGVLLVVIGVIVTILLIRKRKADTFHKAQATPKPTSEPSPPPDQTQEHSQFLPNAESQPEPQKGLFSGFYPDRLQGIAIDSEEAPPMYRGNSVSMAKVNPNSSLGQAKGSGSEHV